MKDQQISTQRRRFVAGSAVAMAAPLAFLNASKSLAQSKHQFGIVGTPAPEIKLDYWIDKDGNAASFSVTENRGKWVLLKCFQDWCPGCHSSGFPTLKAFSDVFWNHPKVAIAGIQTVFEGFSSNTQDDVRKLQVRYQLPITMGHDAGDPNGDHRPVTMRYYRTGGTPWLILIAPDGQVVFNDYHVDTKKLIAFVEQEVDRAKV